MDAVSDDGRQGPPERRSLGALVAELADLRRRINEHRAFVAWLDGRLWARTDSNPPD